MVIAHHLAWTLLAPAAGALLTTLLALGVGGALVWAFSLLNDWTSPPSTEEERLHDWEANQW